MTKLDDPEIKTDDRNLKEVLSDIVTLWNAGKVSFGLASTVPADQPADVEIRLFNSGGGAYAIYVYFPGVGWKSVALS